MIDAHIHVVPPCLPGVGSLDPVLRCPVDALARIVHQQMLESGTRTALAMGACCQTLDDPLGVAGTLALARLVPGLFAIGVANPTWTEPEQLRRAEAVIASGQVKALKAYLGYLHFPPTDAGYRPYYEMAARHRLPVVFHTGDTYSPYAKLKYAHPLLIDDVAVDHPDVRFVIAHVGNPWMQDAAEVVYKNVNVWADLSGLVVGDEASLRSEEQRELREEVIANLRRAFRYAERPNRFLYGTDWPLSPMTAYRDFIRQAIPAVHHAAVFEDNARLLFGLET